MSTVPRNTAWVAASLSLVLAGCHPQIPPATTVSQGPLPGPGPEAGSVVFVSPSSACDRSPYSEIIDDHGHFVANLAPGTRVALAVDPGSYVFYAWSASPWTGWGGFVRTAPVVAVRVNATEGHTEYVALDLNVNVHCRGRMEMRTVQPGDGLWDELQSWLRSTTPVVADRRAGQEALNRNSAHLWRILALGQRQLIDVDQARAERELNARRASE